MISTFARTIVASSAILGAVALEDEVSLFQARATVVSAQGKVTYDSSIADGFGEEADYGDATLSCDTPVSQAPAKEVQLPVEPVVPVIKQSFIEVPKPAMVVPAEAESQDPPGTDFIRLVLQLGTICLLLDGVRRWQRGDTEEKAVLAATVTTKAEVNTESWTTMVKAAKTGDEAGFAKVMAQPNVAMHADAFGCTPLHFAAAGGSVNITKRLLEEKVEIDALDEFAETALHIASRNGHVPVCETLIDSGADINVVNEQGMTPLIVAGHANQEEACRFLADRGAGAGDLKDEDLPPLVVSQIVRRMFAEQ